MMRFLHTLIGGPTGEGKSSAYNPDVFTHGVSLFDSVIRVPLMISHHEISPGLNNSLTSIVDIFPSVLNHCLSADEKSFLPYPLDGLDLLAFLALVGQQA